MMMMVGSKSEEPIKLCASLSFGSSSRNTTIKRHSSPMTCINDSLSPDLILNIFKRLDCLETTTIRRVCKQWLEIIEIHKSFWRALHLPEKSLEWDPSILELFDQKSGSTLQEVEVRVPVKGELLQQQFFDLLKKSEKSLEHLFVNFSLHENNYTQRTDFLEAFPNVKSLMVLYWHQSGKVRLRRRVVQDDPKAASPLKALWYSSDRKMLEVDPVRFQNLVSFETRDNLSPFEWRNFLQGPSKTLKHLRIEFGGEEKFFQGTIPTLELPNLMVLDLDDYQIDYPSWLVIPDSVKLLIRWDCGQLPPVSELWLRHLEFMEEELTDRCARLKTLVLVGPHDDSNRRGALLNILKKRKKNVEVGLEVDGVKMEKIKKLVLPLKLEDYSDSQKAQKFLERCRKLVEVVEGDAQSRFIEIDV